MADSSEKHFKFSMVFSAVETCISYILTGAVIAFMMFFITIEIISRLLFNYSFVGMVDIISLCMIMVAFLSLSGVQRENGHITMDLLPIKLSGTRKGKVLTFINLLFLIVAVFPLIITGTSNTINTYLQGDTTMTIYWPVWPAAVAIPIGCLLMFIRTGMQIWQHLRRSFKSEKRR